VAANSKLATDLRSASPETRALLGGDGQGGVDLFEIGASYDNRDSEIVTRGGTYDEIIARLSPTIGPPLPYSYGEIQLSFSAFLPVGSRVVLAGRLLGDGLFGRPPLWQLPNYSTTSAIGGSLGVRGVPAQRYYGKVKVLENAEARVDVWDFRLLSKPWTLALASFLDAGRVWADWSANPLLDGNGLGIKWGVGGGIRLEQGSGLVVRGDIAWSPDALPIAGYFAAGEIF
jgi:outer membrane protein assembly factor BamA